MHSFRLGIGGRLLLAFLLLAAITLLAAGLSWRSSGELETRLQQLRETSIGVLYAASRLNDQSRQVVAMVPQLVSAESRAERERARQGLDQALNGMEDWMRHLPDYNRYFIEITDQIRNSVELLDTTVVRREQLAWESQQQRQLIHPLYRRLNDSLLARQAASPSPERATMLQIINYLAALAEKVANDTSFNELDYTFLRLEQMAGELDGLDRALPDDERRSLALLLTLVSRDGPLFRLKNEELDLRYQEQFLVANSQRHVRQLATQIAHYSEAANHQVDADIAQSAHTLARTSHATLLLSLLSLLLVAGISWLYVSRNVLARIVRLQRDMRAIASGRLDTPVSIRGRDEVADMARDLRHFQQTALRAERARHRLAREIEDRLHAERQLRLTQEELIQAGKLAALGQLSVAITHEINQPLNAMSTQLHSVGRYLARNEADKAEQGLGKLRQLLDKAGTITRHLRSFARKADSRLSPVALGAVVEAAVELLQPRWRGVTLSIAGDADTLVQAEAIRLEQVLVNLLGNALDALEERPSPEVRIHWRQYRDQVQLCLEDNGCGIPPERLEQIFDPYYTTKAPSKGLGLGLAISYNIMQDLGGQIRLSSTPGRGTTFNLRFNRA
ncbi:hypothetical protein AN401_16905 [Zobellella denitrificans]|uniref:histidine kinase n=1 Tax=Zobellella denitrificans TaxID=347534 RepID=A0A291HT35_9GAMM|nr:ATP-binding protein [Zobellella denitrificans]ATG75330.1 hypothetical protein AN401_16905 [Zobellella denitrificans]